jgi:hypothetical protein
MSETLNRLDTSAGRTDQQHQVISQKVKKIWHWTCRDAEVQMDRRGNQRFPKNAGDRRMKWMDIRT